LRTDNHSMTIARKTIVDVDKVGVYHCVTRCVRRAFLCGQDPYNGRDYEHRRGWISDRLEELAGIFGIDVLAYAALSNHLHSVLRNRPDRVQTWSDQEVVDRWLRLFPKHDLTGKVIEPDEAVIAAFLEDTERIKTCRERLADISWFMRCLNEPIARRANREDECKGRFWEGRFKCQRLADEGSILACMVYVDLNPVRAQMAYGLEDSEFTSIYDRIVAEKAQKRLGEAEKIPSPTLAQKRLIAQEEAASHRADWLCDLSGPDSPLGAGVDFSWYLSLVEWTGQHIREDKPGYIPMDLKPVLERFDLDTENWVENVKSFGGLFQRVAGKIECMVARAREKGVGWFCGRQGSRQLYRQQPG